MAAERELGAPMRPRFIAGLAAASGWKVRGLAAVFGLIAGLGFAPLNLVPAFALGLMGLVWLAAEAPHRRAAFVVGWWWGFGHFAADSYWIARPPGPVPETMRDQF